MSAPGLPRLTSQGRELDTSPEAFGPLRSSTDIADDGAALRSRMQEDGYLYLPGYLEPGGVRTVRKVLTDRLAVAGLLDGRHPAIDCIAKPEHGKYFMPELSDDNPELMALLYSGRVMEFYRSLLGAEVRHFDYTWMRSVGPGGGTAPHCDVVYMGRGTPDLYTAWIPYGDVPFEVGGLMVLEGSHKNERLRAGYGTKDVDAYCTNHGGMRTTGDSGFGALTDHPARIRERLGGRWLSAEYRIGDLLTFSVYTVHASLDNHSREIRLSSDTRYQRASEPADERWVGEHPMGHGDRARREYIC